MFENYLAKQDDLVAVEEALELINHPKLRFIFQEYSRIKRTKVVSYDNKYIYIWCIDPIELTHKIKHKIELKDELQVGWRAGIESSIKDLLPQQIRNTNDFQIPKISGGLLTPFISLQIKKKLKWNPYTKKEGFLATIIHEFAHIYWNSFKMWWLSRKQENLELMNLALRLYQNKGGRTTIPVIIPTPSVVSELFAFCTEYYTSQLFWPVHKRRIDLFAGLKIKKMIKQENYKNLEEEDSNIEPAKYPHEFSLVYGKIIFEKYPNTWPKILTNPKLLSLTL